MVMSLKAVLILGPEIKDTSPKEGFERLMKLYQKKGCLVIGDGVRSLTEKDILSLKGKVDSNTRIDINAHGNFKDNHLLAIFDSRINTKDFFKKMNALSDSEPLNIHLWSCYGKLALIDIHFLPKNSVLTIHAGDKPTLGPLHDFYLEKVIVKLQSYDLNISPFQSYLNDMPESIEESHIITKINDEIHQFSIIPQTMEILANSESFLNQKAADFIKFYQKIYQNHKNDNHFDIREKTLVLPNFTTQEIGDFRSGSFIANCNKNYQILENRDLITIDIANQDMKLISPLSAASGKGHTDVVKLLVEAGADANKADAKGDTPLYMASQNNHTDIVKLLLGAGADVNKDMNNGVTPLYIASQNNHTDIVKLLLGAGADVNKAMDDGVTPLYIASQKGHIAAVELLLQCNADIVKLTSAGYNALDIARYQKHNSIVKILLYVSYGHIKYSPEDCTSYHHNLEVAVTGEMGENNTHHNEL